MSTDAISVESARAASVRRGRRLEYLTIGWNSLEGPIAIASGLLAGSIALVTGVGLIPLALGAGEPGKEIQQPMAVVILGGIVTSTFLNMIVIPALFLKYGRAEGYAPARLPRRA